MWKTTEGSTGRLIQLCIGYFVFYVITGVTVKYFQGRPEDGLPGMDGMEFLVYSTFGGTTIALLVVLVRRWYRLRSGRLVRVGPFQFPQEYLYIVPSGVCTAVVIPTTTLMYSLPISVMVAMVMMRGSVIVISRLVDAIQARQGILKKKVYPVEDVAVAFALLAVAVEPVMGGRDGGFDFLSSPAALTILGSYVCAYAIRIYIMNYYKNTRAPGVKLDNAGFFGVEQIAAAATMLLVATFVATVPASMGWDMPRALAVRRAILDPDPLWAWATLAGTAFGMVAFFSVFIFMFKGRTATFAGLVNRLTSLIAGTAATLISHFAFGGRFPSTSDWISLGFILIAVGFLTVAERRRAEELAREREEVPAERPVPATTGVRG